MAHIILTPYDAAPVNTGGDREAQYSVIWRTDDRLAEIRDTTAPGNYRPFGVAPEFCSLSLDGLEVVGGLPAGGGEDLTSYTNAGPSYGVAVCDGALGVIEPVTGGAYLCSLYVECDVNAAAAVVGFGVNGTIQPEVMNLWNVGGLHSIAITTILTLSAGDTVTLRFHDTGAAGGQIMRVNKAGLTVNKVTS